MRTCAGLRIDWRTELWKSLLIAVWAIVTDGILVANGYENEKQRQMKKPRLVKVESGLGDRIGEKMIALSGEPGRLGGNSAGQPKLDSDLDLTSSSPQWLYQQCARWAAYGP